MGVLHLLRDGYECRDSKTSIAANFICLVLSMATSREPLQSSNHLSGFWNAHDGHVIVFTLKTRIPMLVRWYQYIEMTPSMCSLV